MTSTPTKRRRPQLEQAPPAPRYDFTQLLATDEDLQKHATRTPNGTLKLHLTTRAATYALTRAILRHHFNLTLRLPPGQLVPTIPNRVQYLSWAFSLLPPATPRTPRTVLDIGTGPSCIYPLLGARLFPGCSFVATDTDETAVALARRNVAANKLTTITVLHTSAEGPLLPTEAVAAAPALTVCNPPFHGAAPESAAPAGTTGQLATEGGEYAFLTRLAGESTQSLGVAWFTSLIGCKADLPRVIAYLRSPRVRARHVKSVELSTGGRTTRWAVAWSFGSERSEVALVDEDGSKWRVVLAIVPGRRFANQLRRDDIAASFAIMLCELQWVEENGLHGGDPCDAVFRGERGSALEETSIQLHITEGLSAGEFRATVKVRERGTLSSAELHDLGGQVAQAVSNLLNADDV